jgi:hypothetical protein
LELLWALCNSPITNAYVYCYASKRDVGKGLFESLPVPEIDESQMFRIEFAVNRYLQAALAADRQIMQAVDLDKLRSLLLAVDAEVLRWYDLPPSHERQVLELFPGRNEPRPGVAFEWKGYLPEHFEYAIPYFVYWASMKHGEVALVSAEDAVARAERKALPTTTVALEEEIKLTYEELASLANFREDYGASPPVDARISERFAWLRRLQNAHADVMEAAFRAKFHVSHDEDDRIWERAERLIEKYGNSPTRDTPPSGPVSKKS